MKRLALMGILAAATVAFAQIVTRTETRVMDVTKRYRVEILDLKRCDIVEVEGKIGKAGDVTSGGSVISGTWISVPDNRVKGKPSELTVACLIEVKP